MAHLIQRSSPEAKSTGILLANIGSPEAPTSSALRKYLSEFLSDPRIIDYPRWLWLPILHGIVLNVRPQRSARLYRNIWDKGSPLIKIMEKQAKQLKTLLEERGYNDLVFALGMRYGKSSIANALKTLRIKDVQRILIFPLFPQYSSTTTASTYDAVFDELKSWSWIPEIRLINAYHDHPLYIQALVNSVLEVWETHGVPEKLLFSFHGLPKRYVQTDHTYPEQCLQTSQLVAQRLGLQDADWQVSYQSRFGPEEWLQPYTNQILAKWGQDNLAHVQVICPGFSTDCLDTLEEIDHEVRDIFEESGGRIFHYIPALNNRQDHIEALGEIILQHIQKWMTNSSNNKHHTTNAARPEYTSIA